MQVFSEKVSPGSVGSATGSVGSVATMGMVARLRNIDSGNRV